MADDRNPMQDDPVRDVNDDDIEGRADEQEDEFVEVDDEADELEDSDEGDLE